MTRFVLLFSWIPLVAATAMAGVLSPAKPPLPCVTEYTTGFTGGPSHITAGPGDTLWADEGRNDKIARFDIATHKVTEYQLPRGTMLHDLEEGPDGNMWFTGLANRVGWVDVHTGQVTFIRGVTGQPNHIWWAPDGNMYFSDLASGKLGRYDPRTQVLTQKADGLPPGNGIHSVAPLPDGTAWWGLEDAGELAHFNPRTQRFDKLVKLPTGTLPHWMVYVPTDGAIWIDDELNSRLLRYDPSTGAIHDYPAPISKTTQSAISSQAFKPYLTQMVADRNGQYLWIATAAGGELLRFNLHSDKYTGVSCGLSIPNLTLVVTLDQRGEVWVAEPLPGGLGYVKQH